MADLHAGGPRGPGASVSSVLNESIGRADWRRARAFLTQAVHLSQGKDRRDMVGEVLAGLAREVSALAPSYRGREEDLARHALAVFSDVAGHEDLDLKAFRASYRDGRFSFREDVTSKRQPSPYEAITETCRRLRDAGHLDQAMRGTGTAGLLCGSVSYGRFFSVRGNRELIPASDLDIVLVVKEAPDAQVVADRLAAMDGITQEDVDHLRRRAAIFASRYDDEKTALSHKLTMWPQRGTDPLLPDSRLSPAYYLSLHMLTLPVLLNVLADVSPSILRESAGTRRTVWDFRDKPTERKDEQRNFAGFRTVLSSKIRAVDHGFIRSASAYLIDESDHYSPGFFQTIVLPDFDLLWDDAGIRTHLQAFRRKFIERLRHERQLDQFTDLRASFTHPRRGLFAPHVVQRFDQEYSAQ